MASDDDIFWTYGDKRKRTAKTKNNNIDESNKKPIEKQQVYKQEEIQKDRIEATPERQQQNDIQMKSIRLNPFSAGGSGQGGVNFNVSQRIDRFDDRQGGNHGMNQSNILGIQQQQNRNQGNNHHNGMQYSYQKQYNNENINHSHNNNKYSDSDSKNQENFNFTFSPSEKGSSSRQKNKNGALAMSQTTTSNFVFDTASPARRSSINNRKKFNTSAKKVQDFSPSIYDQVNAEQFKFQRKGESIWDDLYNNAKAMLNKKMKLHEMKQNEHDQECVFQPQLVSNGNKYFQYENNKFLERNEQWKEHRDNKLISQRQSKISIDLKECTFQPNINTTRINTEIPKEQELDFVKDKIGRAKDTSRALSYSKSLYRVSQVQSPPSKGYQQGIHNLDFKQTGGIVKSYYIRERERFEKCKKMLSQALKKTPDETIL